MINLDRYKNISYKKRSNCVICSKPLTDPLIKLPQFPLTEVYIQEALPTPLGLVDQEFYYCENCGHGQISNIIEPQLLYGETYQTRTSTSASAISAVEIFIQFINENLKDRQINILIEIGCNDLYTLKRFQNRANILYGIDPVLKDHLNDENNNILLIADFIENIDFDFLPSKIDVTICSHTLEHISNPKITIKKVLDISDENSIIFFQFPSLEGLVNDARFDQIFHQHLNYFSLKSVFYMLEELDAELIAFKFNPYHWTSLMIAFQKKSKLGTNNIKNYKNNIISYKREDILKQYDIFKNCMNITNYRINALKNEKIYGFGAALMLPVLDYHLNDGLIKLISILDQDPNKTGKFYLNVPIKVIHPDEIHNINEAIILLTAINSLDAGRKIIPKLIDYNVKQIILPLNII